MATGSRVLPHNLDAERSILGGILLRNDALNLLESLDAEDFYDPRNKAVFEAMRALEEKTKPIDTVTCEEELARIGKLDAIGGVAYLSEVALATPTADNITHYAEIVQDRSTARKLMLASSDIAAKGYDNYGEITDYLDEAEQKIFEITQRNQRGGAEPIKKLLVQLFNEFDSRYSSDGISGIPSYFADLDKKTAGLHPSDLVILAARPAMGKTSLALSIAHNAAMLGGWPCLVFSLEMSSLQLTERMLCSEAKIEAFALRAGTLNRQDMSNLTFAANQLSKAPIFIDDTPALSMREARAKVRRWVGNREVFNDKKQGLIVVDYLQLMRGTSAKAANSREQEISEISRGLKALAKEVNCPVLALSQLNRGVESRDDKRPRMSDLRESGAIEQDADMILFIYRDEVYNQETDARGVAEVIVGKNRHGPIGTAELKFEGRYTRFDNLSQRDDYDELGGQPPPPEDEGGAPAPF